MWDLFTSLNRSAIIGLISPSAYRWITTTVVERFAGCSVVDAIRGSAVLKRTEIGFSPPLGMCKPRAEF